MSVANPLDHRLEPRRNYVNVLRSPRFAGYGNLGQNSISRQSWAKNNSMCLIVRACERSCIESTPYPKRHANLTSPPSGSDRVKSGGRCLEPSGTATATATTHLKT